MGVIYRITSPNNKIYIGQTIYSAQKRWKEHIIDAYDAKKNHCKLLNASIRKYNPDDFKIEVVVECDNNDLDYLEQYYIKFEKTYSPYGLNLKLGGSNGQHLDSTKQKISNALKGCHVPKERREKLSATKKNNGLPMYIIEYKKNGDVKGYRVCNHPNGMEKKFTKHGNLQQNLNAAIDHVKYLDSLDSPLIPVVRNVEKHIQHYKKGFCVSYNGTKKYFVASSRSTEENLELAKNCLLEMKTMEAVQRLNGSGCDESRA